VNERVSLFVYVCCVFIMNKCLDACSQTSYLDSAFIWLVRSYYLVCIRYNPMHFHCIVPFLRTIGATHGIAIFPLPKGRFEDSGLYSSAARGVVDCTFIGSLVVIFEQPHSNSVHRRVCVCDSFSGSTKEVCRRTLTSLSDIRSPPCQYVAY
jgi:hypothetical protein